MNLQPFDFQVWNSTEPGDLARWLAAWQSWPRREVFAHPDYLGLFAGKEDRVLCAASSDGRSTVMYPFLCRDLKALPWFRRNEGPLADITTPYGYGGPFTWGAEATPRLATAFWESLDGWAEENHVVSEFIRFSLFPDGLLPYPGQKHIRYSNVVRELDLDDETLWMDFKHKVRKNIKKAQRSGVEIEQDAAGRRLDDFLRIYIGTMDRRSSSEGYYFAGEFFKSIQKNLVGQFTYFHAIYEDRLVSTELVLVSAENVYSFLGGTDRSAFAVRPNDLLKYEIIRWARNEGKKRFVLGGGYQPEDGIYQYKLSFAPHGAVPFMTGQRILRDNPYRRLVRERSAVCRFQGNDWCPRPEFFPAYRA